MDQIRSRTTTVFFSHHSAAPIIALPQSQDDIRYVRAWNMGDSIDYEHNGLVTKVAFNQSLLGQNISRGLSELGTWITYSDWHSVQSSPEELVGFFHYRRILNGLRRTSIERVRPDFLSSYAVSKAVRRLRNSVDSGFYSANSMDLSGVSSHYKANHPESFKTYEFFRDFAFQILEFQPSLKRTYEERFFPATLFFGSREVAQNFTSLVARLLSEAPNDAPLPESESLGSYSERWPGFVFERIFSMFVISEHAKGTPHLKSQLTRLTSHQAL